jgi:AcrR family transcriptional regulator
MNMFSFIQSLPSPLTDKADRTRQRIFDSALTLFRANGYEQTTMRQVAAASGSSLGLAYRYFSSKEELIYAFYYSLAGDFIRHIPSLPPGKLSQRFAAAIEFKLSLIEPHLDLISVLLSSALNPNSRIAVLGDETSEIRKQMELAFEQIVVGSADAPGPPVAHRLAKLLYAAHLGLLFFRANDRSPAGSATRSVLGLLESALDYLPLAIRFPGFTQTLGRIADSLDAVLGGKIHEPATE